MSKEQPRKIREVIDLMMESSDGEQVTLGDLLETFASRSHGAMLMVPAMVLILPTGAIPGMPIVVSGLLVLIAGQIMLSRQRLWMPKKLLNFEFPREKLVDALEKLKKWVRPLDGMASRRWNWLTGPPMVAIIALLCIVLAVLIVPIGVIPFAVMLPGLNVLVLGFGLLTRDGRIVLVGISATVGCGWLAYHAFRVMSG